MRRGLAEAEAGGGRVRRGQRPGWPVVQRRPGQRMGAAVAGPERAGSQVEEAGKRHGSPARRSGQRQQRPDTAEAQLGAGGGGELEAGGGKEGAVWRGEPGPAGGLAAGARGWRMGRKGAGKEMSRLNHLLALPLPCVGEPTAAFRVSPGSSPVRSEASEGAAALYAADAELDPEPEASAGRSTQMLLAMAAMGRRGGTYGRRPTSSYGSCAAWRLLGHARWVWMLGEINMGTDLSLDLKMFVAKSLAGHVRDAPASAMDDCIRQLEEEKGKIEVFGASSPSACASSLT